MADRINVTTPVGRIVMGDLYKGSTTDAEGKPLVVKTGPNAGQPRANYFFALPIPKTGEPHWAHTAWGKQIWEVGCRAFPNAAQSPAFAWKIEDGDSQIPNKRGRKPCENEGWPGHWVLKFSGGFAPKIYEQQNGGYVLLTEPGRVKPGYFAEVALSVEGNGSQSQPGVYLNHSMVCFRAYGQEIVFGPDVNAAGFGQSPLPAGASMTPPAGAIPMPQAGVPGVPTVPGSVPAPGQIPGAVPVPLDQLPGGSVPMPSAPAATASAPIPVTPNPGFVQVPPPAAAPAPMAPPPAPAAPVRQMTAAAQGIPYESYVAQGWTDAQLVQNGLMLA